MRKLPAALAALGGALVLSQAPCGLARGDATPLGEIDLSAPVYTAAEVDALVPSAPVWDVAAIGANPTVALAAAANTAYRRTGSGVLTLSAVTGLTADPTYLVAAGFDSLVLPSGFAVAGSGAFRSGKENHLALWSTPTTNLVNFLFAQ